jgi:hypothetical protein
MNSLMLPDIRSLFAVNKDGSIAVTFICDRTHKYVDFNVQYGDYGIGQIVGYTQSKTAMDLFTMHEAFNWLTHNEYLPYKD